LEKEKYLKIFRGRESLILSLEKNLGYQFKDKSLLVRALIHSSFANEKHEDKLKSNERFEFIGDSVLNYIISTTLFKIFPEVNEGTLSKYRSFLVSTNTIYEISSKMDLGRYLILGKGEEKTGGNKKKNLIVDCFEAIVAAIYFDGGLKNLRKVILRLYRKKLRELKREDFVLFDYKSKLQEILAKKGLPSPKYVVLGESGPDHAKVFRVQVTIDGEGYGIGTGSSKKEAQQNAAKNTIFILKG